MGLALSRTAEARWLVAFAHWGTTHHAVESVQRRGAQRFAAADCDLVIGHGPHLAQPVEIVDDMPVFYPLGNFILGTPGRYSDDTPGISVPALTELTAMGFRAAKLRCLLTENREVDFRPRICEQAVAAVLLPDLLTEIDLVRESTLASVTAGSQIGR